MKAPFGSSLWPAVWRPLIAVFVSLVLACAAPGQTLPTGGKTPDKPPAESLPTPELVSFAVDGATLHGWLYKPEGKGPFPAVIYNHGSDKVPGWFPTLG